MFKYFVLFYLLVHVAAEENGKKSFTIVLDTTVSMRDEIDILKSNIESIVGRHLTDVVDNYILLPFNDPGFGPPIIMSKPRQLIEVASIVEVSGGRDCPENFVPAIQQALSISKPNSYIFLFTDGYAKDYSELNSIQSLCRDKNSQVIIFLSGKCVPANGREAAGTIDPYFDVAESCSGTVLKFDLTNFRQAFKVMQELTKTEWSDIKVHKIYIEPMQFTFLVDKYTKDVTVVISGEYPIIEITDINGRWPSVEYIINTRQSKVVKLIKPPIGLYTLNILCQGPTIATVYKKRQLEFQYGFSPKISRSLKETSNLPLPGATSYIYLQVAKISIELNSVLIRVDGIGVKKINVEIVDRNNGLYAAQQYFAPEKSFTITIYGQDDQYQIIKGTTGTLKPQTQMQVALTKKPTIQMIEPSVALVDFNSNFTIACKVSGYPKPIITWYDEVGTVINSEDALLEIPSVYISYAFIEKVTKNSTIYCKCESEKGMESRPMELYVNRTFTFEVIKYPEDATFEYGTEGKLFCKIDAYPEATIKWYHNDSLVEDSYNLEIVPEENMIRINNMTIDYTGEYKCEISNSVKTKTYVALVDISGMEEPQIELKDSVLVLKLDQWVNIECILNKGNPTPRIYWTLETPDGFKVIPDGVFAEGNFLKIPSVKTEHRGVYRCEAVNVFGSDAKELQIEVQYAPKIRFNEKEKTVKRNEYVQLSCEVDAVPKPQVRWEMMKGNVTVPLDSRYAIDEWNTLSFTALKNDTGSYRCIAENVLGKAERTTILNVMVTPYIQPPPLKLVTLKTGDTITLPCHVLYGHPVPETKWEFIASNATVTTVMRGGSINNLILRNVMKQHEGSYICLAENDAGSDTIKIIVNIF